MSGARVIRNAGVGDAEALARLAERTFRQAFAAQNTAGDMDLHCAAHYGEPQQRAEIEDPSFATVVVEEGGSMIAYAQLRWGEPPTFVSAVQPAEILRFYVDRAWHGSGLAAELMASVLLRAEAADVVWLGVWEKNRRAIAFYRKWGFVEVGEQVFHVGSDPQRDLVLARASRQSSGTLACSGCSPADSDAEVKGKVRHRRQG